MSGLIWIQTIGHSDGILFEKVDFEKNSRCQKSIKIYQGYKELRQKTRQCAALITYEFTPMWKVILYMHIMGGSRKFCRGGGGEYF